MAAITPEKLNELMLKLRKGATASFSLPQIAAILETFGGSITPIVGLVSQDTPGRKSHLMAETPEEAETITKFLKSLYVSSPPSKPKVGVIYVTKISPPDPKNGVFYIDTESSIGANGVRIELGSQKIDLFPSQYNLPELRHYDREGPQKKPFPTHIAIEWLTKNTDWVDRAIKFLGMEDHIPAAARTRDQTGSCPVCFQNVKLAGGKLVLHGYKRPGSGTVHGKCFGVGYEPFEVSPKGVSDYLAQQLIPIVEGLKRRLASLKSGDMKTLNIGRASPKIVTPDDPKWGTYLQNEIDEVEGSLQAEEAERDAFERLRTHWKERPLPKEGERHIDWFYAGQKSASASRMASSIRVAASVRVAKIHALKVALDTKRWGPFTFEIDRPKGYKKEWPQDDGSVKKYTYPVDYGYFVGHTGEDEEGLDAFVGEDPEGKIESFLKMKPSEDGETLVPDETKFLVGCSDEEREKILGLYEPEMIVGLREYDDVYELISVLNAFRDRTASIRVASRFMETKKSL